MAAYVIFLREDPVHNEAEMTEYRRKNAENKGDFKIKPLVVYGALEALEGKAPDGVIIVEFPTMEDAKAWYNSPGYQAALPHRKAGANYRAILVQGI